MTSVRYACEFDHSGYAVAARRYVHALDAAGVDVSWQPLVNVRRGRVVADPAEVVGDCTADPDLVRMAAHDRSTQPDTTLLHCIPTTWRECFDQIGGTRRIGQTVWETEQMPRRWQQELAAADEVWVPTGWNADTLRRGGWDKPIHVVPHITAPEGHTAEPPLDLPADVTVIAAIAQWERRKRPDLTIEAFLRAFTADDPVILVVKTGPAIIAWATQSAVERNTWWQVTQLVKAHRRPGNVVLDTSLWTDAQIGGLLARADCYLSLTATEGWGLGAFDAAAAGVPVVMTGWGGQREWLPADYPGVVPYMLEPVDHPDRTLFEPAMIWARADVDAAAEVLRQLRNDPQAFTSSAAALAADLRDRYSPERIGGQMAELLR